MTRFDAKPPLLRVRGLAKSYVQRRSLTRSKFRVRAFEEISLDVPQGVTLAIVGESGAGKSSLARCLALLETADSGTIEFEGKILSGLAQAELFQLRRKIQLIFQDSTSALNPRFTAAQAVAEPLQIQRMFRVADRHDRAIELMQQVGLPAESAKKLPSEFSGGQRQRLAIARALALEPKLLILDEALANLDAANQEMILRLLADLRARHMMTYIFISHDLHLVSQFADEVAVMRGGRIEEQKQCEDLFTRPENEYTRELIHAVPPLESILEQRFEKEPI